MVSDQWSVTSKSDKAWEGGKAENGKTGKTVASDQWSVACRKEEERQWSVASGQ